ncbi:hypothetical protein KI387_023380 [Taxus chinensis]|uniref:Phosphoglucan phosphatase LSF2, chloroplastic n=1 Tax=Taxus chinensis TaxID=29808 RepID=A0AA38G4R1_TAXCH|nr:hypothetical protein KI387_023380 [Taxus chinensis]
MACTLSHSLKWTSSGSNLCNTKYQVPSILIKRRRLCIPISLAKGNEIIMASLGPKGTKTDQYNEEMQRRMRNPYEYHHDLGMHYTRITPNLIVGSQPQSVEDIDKLKEEEGVSAILNLQQDTDVAYWGIDLASIVRRCNELGIRHMRRPAQDFDPDSLRKILPKAVSSLQWAISKGGTVYVHCTAGLGRAPAVAIAYLFWFCDMDLNLAYNMVTSKRPCGPKRDAIRGATYDLAKNDPWKESFESLPDSAFTGVAHWERKLIQDRVCAIGR